MILDAQWITLTWMLLSGVVMGAAYDSYRVLSGRTAVSEVEHPYT